MQSKLKSAVALASTAAAIFAMGGAVTVVQAADAPTVHCAGVNSCKGTSDCKTAKNECKGQNGCKGQGWTGKASEKECTAAGGKVVK